jgi:hypothetical protein
MKFLLCFVSLFIMLLNSNAMAEVIEIPNGCLDKSLWPCTMHVTKQNKEFLVKGGRIHVLPGTTAYLESENEIKLVRGQFLIESADDKIQVSTLFGQINTMNGKSLVTVQDHKTDFVNLSATLSYTPRGENKSYDLPAAYVMTLSPVGETGIANTAFPAPAVIEPTIQLWAKFYKSKDLKVLTEELKAFRTAWTSVTESVRSWYEESIQREVAALRSAERRKKAAIEASDRDDQVYRQMLKDRVFSN